MNWLDWLIAATVAASVVAGLYRGFARTVVGIVAVLLGIVLGAWTYGVAGGWLRDFVSHPAIANFVGFLLVFLAVVLAGTAAGYVLAKLFKWVGLGWLDRMMGGALGLVRGSLVAMVLVMALCGFSRTPVPPSVATSRFSPYIIDASSVLVSVAPRELKDGFEQSHRKVKQLWEDMVKKANQRMAQNLP